MELTRRYKTEDFFTFLEEMELAAHTKIKKCFVSTLIIL